MGSQVCYIFKNQPDNSNSVEMNTISSIIKRLSLEHIDEMDELNTYLRIGENIVGQSKVKMVMNIMST